MRAPSRRYLTLGIRLPEMVEGVIKNSAVSLFGLATKLGVQRLPAFDRIFLALYEIYKRRFEAGPIERLREFVPDGSLVIDVGANVGFFTLLFADWVGAGEVIAIEPEDKNYRRLATAIEREGLSGRVRALKAVAAATSGTMLLQINPLHPADHKLSRDGSGLVVEAVTLDELVHDKGRLRPSLIKIDVQGAEMLVLQGTADILKVSRPALFVELCENALAQFETSASAVLDHLIQQDYLPHWLVRSGPLPAAKPEEILRKVAATGYVDVLFLAGPI